MKKEHSALLFCVDMPPKTNKHPSISDMCLNHCPRPYYRSGCLQNDMERGGNIGRCWSIVLRRRFGSPSDENIEPGTIFALDKKNA